MLIVKYIVIIFNLVCEAVISKIKKIGLLKLFVIFLAFGLQLFFVLRFFNNTNKVAVGGEEGSPFFSEGGL